MKRYVSLECQIYNNFILINEGPNNTLKLIGIVSWNSKTPCGNTQVSRQTLHTEFVVTLNLKHLHKRKQELLM